MKKMIITFGLTLATAFYSCQSQAVELLILAGLGGALITTSGLIGENAGSTTGPHKEAQQIIQDVQEYNQTGIKSPFLNQKIKDIQLLSEDEGVSEENAMDTLILNSLEILK